MEGIALFLLKSAAWLSGFTLCYILLLRKERFFRLKRAYLLAGMVLSLLFPLITVHYRVELPAPVVQQVNAAAVDTVLQPTAMPGTREGKQLLQLFLLLYATGMMLLLCRTLFYFHSLHRVIRSASVEREGELLLVRTEKYTSAFSFFNYVFINLSVSEQEVREILNHEMVHHKNKHWFDLLIVEVMSLIQWMNPFAWVYSALVRQNHEHLADEEALQNSSDPAAYRAALLNQVFNARLLSLSNSFSFSFNTNRFEMMKKIAFSPYRKLKLLIVLPLAAALFYAFASPRYVYAEPSASSGLNAEEEETLVQKNIKGVVYREDGTPFPGVSVNVSGTSMTAITDSDGRFEFRSIPENVIIMFSHKGYKPSLVKAVFDKEIAVDMSPDPDYVDPATIKPDPDIKLPVVVVDGVLTDENERTVMERMIDDLGSYKRLSPQEAVAKYGNKGTAGAVEIWSVKKAREMGMNVPLRRESENDFPTFEGNSYLAFNDWVVSRTTYPVEAARNGIEGWAHVSYTVNSDGSVTNVKPAGATNTLLGMALAEVIRTSPLWTPPVNPEMNEPFTAEVVAKFTLPDEVSNGEIFTVIEEMPAYPGGDQALFNDLYENLEYPPEAKEQGIQGRVILRCVVTAEGKTADITVIRSVHPLLDAEAVKALSGIGNWIPGKQGGKPVDVYYAIPINFSIKTDTVKE
jgi:TonB family protein